VIRNPCTTCRGKGAVNQSVKETINIPKGVDNGVNLRVSKKGNQGLQGPAGDLMIQVKVKPHPYFKRDGSDIHTDLFISIADVSSYFIFFLILIYFLGCPWFRS
jgi:molecular chaperone DnaJ|tara:strand:+ start:992 stop:1303 length:312 start_codon:yes stop_codon:yes gene_type:complete